MIRVMAVLSVVMMFTMCFVGGTFAKYTTGDSGDDSARVAKWGVTVEGTADTFAETYAKNDNSFIVAANTVVSTSGYVVAPGTSGNMAAFTITGTPEVAVRVAEEGELQGGQSNIVNGSFEDPSNYRLVDLALALGSQTGYKEKTPQGEIPGWNTTSTEGAIELGWLKENGTSPHMNPTVVAEITGGVGASDGLQFAETIGNESSTLYQSLS